MLNNNFSDEEKRLVSVVPSPAQLEHSKRPFYCFIHFGMNTSTGREWGSGSETVNDFKITEIHPEQWVKAVKSAGAEGLILTCKHHDGFCLWDTKKTDFSVMNTALKTDIVKAVSEECKKQNIAFGVYLSPWDMHEKSYATEEYNDFFCAQLTELLSNYGEIFEVWFDGAKGSDAKAFEYDWQRYYGVVRALQPMANIAICGPDIRWVGNEAGKGRKNEYCVVDSSLTTAETVEKSSQHSPSEAEKMRKFTSKDEDLGSRKALKNSKELVWYPAEVDVSIRKGWFYPGGGKVKSAEELFSIYLGSVGSNAFLLLNVPPNDKGLIAEEDLKSLEGLGKKIAALTANPAEIKEYSENEKTPREIRFDFKNEKKIEYCIIEENTLFSQRVEEFEIYITKSGGKEKRVYKGGVIGMKKIVHIGEKSLGARLVIKKSRCEPVIKRIGFYL